MASRICHPNLLQFIGATNVGEMALPNINHCWKAKVSDYGTVNLLQRLDTICSGNPSYAAPEANDPNQQSTKMDIFSFGALLLEMLTGTERHDDIVHMLPCRLALAGWQLVVLIIMCYCCVCADELPASDHVCSVWFITSHCWLSSRCV